MKRISVILSTLMILSLLGITNSGVSAADYPVFFVGDTEVTATQDGTTYWIEDETTSPATEFTVTGASADNYDFSLAYDHTNGYMLTANGLDIETYGMYNDGSTTYQGGIICMSALDIVVDAGGLSVTETTVGVNGIYTDGALDVTGTGDVTISSAFIAIGNSFTFDIDGKVSLSATGFAPVIFGTATIMAGSDISITNTSSSGSTLVTADAVLTSENGGVALTVAGSGPLVGGDFTVDAYADVTLESTASGIIVYGDSDITSQNGAITADSNGGTPAFAGTAKMTAKDDITLTNESFMVFDSSATLTSNNGKVTVIGNTNGAPVIGDVATIQAKDNIAIINATVGGFCMSGTADLTSTDGTVTAACNSGAPLFEGNIDISAKGNVSLENQGTGNIATNGVTITSSAGAVTVTSATTTSPVIQSNAEITAYGDITITATAAGGCISGYANLTSQHGSVDVSGNSSYSIIGGLAMGGTSTLVAENDISVVNLGIDSAFCNPTTLQSKNGNINIASEGYQVANATVKVNLGSVDKTATFTSKMGEAVPVGFTTDMIAYRVYGGADVDHLAAISLTDATDYYCVQFALAFDVTAGSTNLGDIIDDGAGHYTITAADGLTYEQGGAATAGAYLGAYFNGLTGTNGTDYYLSYGDSDSVTWDESKAITANEGEVDPSLYVNLVNGEKTLFVYFDPDADGTDFAGSVLTIDYQIPDGATYDDGTDEYTWNGASWTKEARNPFTDVHTGSWYYEDVAYVYANGLMIGTDANSFTPNGLLTRSALVLMLWRLEGEPAATAANSFTDVNEDAYYAESVAWAAEINIVHGYGQNKFGPGDAITREQFATVLYRYAAYKEYDVSGSADLSGYTDAGQISGYALTAMKWTNENGIINGTSSTTLSPQGGATRAQAAAMLHRFMVNFVEEV
jgi:hypothetical protein